MVQFKISAGFVMKIISLSTLYYNTYAVHSTAAAADQTIVFIYANEARAEYT